MDNDSYCGSNDSPVHRGNQGERGTVLDAEFVERLGDIQPYAVGLVQFVSRTGLQPGEAPALEFVVKQLHDVVEEGLDRHRSRIYLRNQVFSTYDRNRATGRKRYLPTTRSLARPVGIWNVFVSQCRSDFEYAATGFSSSTRAGYRLSRL